jgi:hypothetical protein
MADSFITAKGLSFLQPIPFEEINKLNNVRIVSRFTDKLIHTKSYSDFYFKINYEVRTSGSFPFKKKKYFMKAIFTGDEFNQFERVEMFKVIYFLIKETNYRFKIIGGGFYPIEDDDSYDYTEIQRSFSYELW